MVEMWKPYKSEGGLNYAVSSHGNVFSFFSGKYLKNSLTPSGYVQHGSLLGSQHRLVARVFLGDIPDDYQINHIDGVKTNNHISNLEIVTAAQNVQHAYKTGLMVPAEGAKNGMSKLEACDIISAYNMMSVGASNKEVADVLGVHDRYVSLVRHGKRWRHLYDERGEVFPKSYNYKISKSLIILANSLIKEGVTNVEISRVTGIERSMISRIRTGDCYKDFIESYNKILKRGGE